MATEKKIISLTVKVGLVLFALCILAPVSLMVLFRHAVPLQTLRLLFSAGSASLVAWEEVKMYSANKGALMCECDMSSLRSDVCELRGDVRVILSNITIIALLHPNVSVRRRSWRMKPHARKNDGHALANVTEVLVSVTPSSPYAPGCTAESAAPAVVFSVGGYAGNMFHDFTDVLIPLFITASRFRSDVHLLVSDAPPWWLDKYRPLLQGLSRHAVIDMHRQSAEVLCYPHVVVGLSFHKEMSIDTAKTVGGHYSMADFARLARRSYGLERDTAIRLLHGGDNIKSPRRPRLLIISRKTTRAFTNMGAVAQAAAMLGYEVVPLGGLEAMARDDFGEPAADMGLGYVQYGIAVGESTLAELYPRDRRVLRDLALRSAYLVSQNVTLDVARFSGALSRALELLHR
ncbi:unnamed protein product [Triticum turgidum subsp. durum]|uniref:Uncharacterized protein n=1 Tax=Triticum turgidum subsp. durum TaxID=4567 RepID=A0A9R1Q5S5_TRITD|nr:unnamed protein product [Triticum turgidum subsp. durum]